MVTASNTGLPGMVPYYLIVTCLGPDCHDIPCRCYGVPDLLLVPAHPPVDGSSNTKGSADTVWFQRYGLRVAPLAMVPGSMPASDGPCCLYWSVAAVDKVQGNVTTLYH
jgi:hypothetical protein